jgi:1-phosphatidylinositol-4-phosphate 5-kinase
MPFIRRKATTMKGSKSPEAIAMRRAMRESDPKKLGDETIKLPEEDTGERQSLIFYQDEGGLRATDEVNDSMATIYYLGVIDILTPYTIMKKLEHCWKGLSADRVSGTTYLSYSWGIYLCLRSTKSVPSSLRNIASDSSRS